ncbi:hypothetical protein TPA0905_24100 [Streptomyces olivaceus]|nr:hypothetical protein TPA0905_24100 [Streptomyces olivaceus]
MRHDRLLATGECERRRIRARGPAPGAADGVGPSAARRPSSFVVRPQSAIRRPLSSGTGLRSGGAGVGTGLPRKAAGPAARTPYARSPRPQPSVRGGFSDGPFDLAR